MNDLSLNDGSYKLLVPNQYAPNDINMFERNTYELDYSDVHPNDNMTTGND